jgi:hypothetical protein
MDKLIIVEDDEFVARAVLFAAIVGLLFACSAEKMPPEEMDAAVLDDSGTADGGIEDGGGGFADAAPIVCDVVAPNTCPTPPVTYGDIQPIIRDRCLSCHDGSGEEWPLSTYTHAADWYDEIRSMMLSCTMPPPTSNIPMSTAEREQLLLWIRCGFPE